MSIAGTLRPLVLRGYYIDGYAIYMPIERIHAGSSKPQQATALGRRRVLQIGFWAGILAAVGAISATVANSLYPRKVSGFGGPIAVSSDRIPQPGDAPAQIFEARCWLVNLLPNEGRHASDDTPSSGGLMALWRKCPHLGCSVPWKDDFVSQEDDLRRRGMFNCNCHGSTYTKAGTLVVGPAERAMDTMAIEMTEAGIVIQTGQIKRGTQDNPRRAVPYG